MPALELPGLILSPLEIEKGTAKCDLTLFITDSEEGLVGLWEYNTDLFEPATMTRMLGIFRSCWKASLPSLSSPSQPCRS